MNKLIYKIKYLFNKDNFNAEYVSTLDKFKYKYKRKQIKYIKDLRKEIVKSAKIGARSVYTDELNFYPWLTKEYFEFLKKDFMDKGFKVDTINYEGDICLKIEW